MELHPTDERKKLTTSAPTHQHTKRAWRKPRPPVRSSRFTGVRIPDDPREVDPRHGTPSGFPKLPDYSFGVSGAPIQRWTGTHVPTGSTHKGDVSREHPDSIEATDSSSLAHIMPSRIARAVPRRRGLTWPISEAPLDADPVQQPMFYLAPISSLQVAITASFAALIASIVPGLSSIQRVFNSTRMSRAVSASPTWR